MLFVNFGSRIQRLIINILWKSASEDLQHQTNQWTSPNRNGNLHPKTFKTQKESQWKPPNLNGNLHPTTFKIQKESMDISKSQWKFASKGLQNHAVVTLTSIFFFFKLKFRDRSVFFFLFSFCFPSKLTYLYKTSKLMFSKGVLVQAG